MQIITVTAKCPRCKKTKKYSSDEPLNHAPYCPNGCGAPMLIGNISVKNVRKR